MKFPISRQEEQSFPEFRSHKEAASFFKEKFGPDFVFESSDLIDGTICYFYSVVVDHSVYYKCNQLLADGKSVSGELGMKFISSYQPIQIMENGNVHIVY